MSVFQTWTPMEELVRRIGDVGPCTVLVKDSVACRGGFVLHYLLTKLLSDASSRVVLLGLSEPFSHYNRVARKQGCNLQAWREKGRFLFMGLSHEVFEDSVKSSTGNSRETTAVGSGAAAATAGSEASGNSDANPLAALYLRLRDVAQKLPITRHSEGVGGEQTCIIIDDISVLDVVTGGSHYAVLDFLHYCQALMCGNRRCSVVLLTHQGVYEEPAHSYMGLELEYASDTIVDVEPLVTGLAVDVHGQLTIHHRTEPSAAHRSSGAPLIRFQRIQFRILENAVQFFLPGQL